MAQGAVLALQLYALITALDVVVAWIQPRPEAWPRRGLHLLTEPAQRPLRRLLPPGRLGGWDLSPLVVIAIVATVRVWFHLP